MARIAGINLPKGKRVEIALTYIYGIGRSTSKTILQNLKIDLDKNIPHINGNKYKLEQVILNLLTNAKDEIEEKQTNSNSSYHKEILIKTYTKNQNTILEVKDNGNGISKDNIKKIFDPFFTTKDPAKGTGLGLSIIYGIIKEINGEIAVESELGKFTTMRIIF